MLKKKLMRCGFKLNTIKTTRWKRIKYSVHDVHISNLNLYKTVLGGSLKEKSLFLSTHLYFISL